MRKVLLILLLLVLFLLPPSAASAYCFEEAGAVYGINPTLLWAIAKVESSFNPLAINRNSNGSYDFGLMQINSSWYRTLGDEVWQRLADPCVNVYVGAWVLAQCMQRYGYTWEAVGCYNAVTKSKRDRYIKRVVNVLKNINHEK